jgi:hypothetical protein
LARLNVNKTTTHQLLFQEKTEMQILLQAIKCK